MPGPLRVLFVCTANTGRSALAEALLRAHATERGVPVRVGSAGHRTDGGEPVSPLVEQAVGRHGGLVVDTSSRRMDFGLAHTVLVSFGYHYGLNYALGRLLRRRVLGPAPAIRTDQARSARRWRRGWRVVAVVTTAVLVVRAARRRNG